MKINILTRVAATVLAGGFLLAGHAQESAPQPTASATASMSPKAANRALAKKIRHALARTKGLDPNRIFVKASNGAVTLSGSCNSEQEVSLAVETAQKVPGVISLKNNLSIKTPQ